MNAASHPDPSFVESAVSPSLGELIDAVTSDQIDRFSFETIELVTTAFQSFAKELASRSHPVQFEFVEVSLEAVKDKAERHFLNEIGTSFSLTNVQVDRLIDTGRSVLRASPQYREALDLMRGGAKASGRRPASPKHPPSPQNRGSGATR